MALRPLIACVVAALGLLVACGGGGSGDSTPPDDGVGFAPANPGASLDKAGGQCATDADCASGFSCMTVSLGEFAQKSCVASGTDAGTGGPGANDASIVPNVDGGPAPSGDAGVTDANYTCSKPLVVTITSVLPNPRPKCYLNTTVDTSSPALLGYACGGGTASVTFGAQTFAGTDTTGGVVTVQNKSTYPITSPYLGGVTCNVDAFQTITGSIASGTLQYTYTEAFTPGQSSICPLAFLLCSASGSVAVK